MSKPAVRFAAVIGHADQDALLASCVRHHLAIGVERVFVSVNDEAAAWPDWLDGDERVRAVPASTFAAPDMFQYFGHALRAMVEWAAPDWVLFADSDEMWLPKGGNIADTARLSETDLYIVERYNCLPQLQRDGTVLPPDLAEPYRQPLMLVRENIEDSYLAGDHRIPWIMGGDAPKLLVRPVLVHQVGAGGHSVRSGTADVRWHMPDDLFILHAPFTTLARFTRKIAAIRTVMANHGPRFDARQAWHWRYWAKLSDDAVAAEFRRQCLRASAVPLLRQQAVVGEAADLYPRLRQQADAVDGNALANLLRRTIQRG